MISAAAYCTTVSVSVNVSYPGFVTVGAVTTFVIFSTIASVAEISSERLPWILSCWAVISLATNVDCSSMLMSWSVFADANVQPWSVAPTGVHRGCVMDNVPPVTPVGVSDHVPPRSRSARAIVNGVATALAGPPPTTTSVVSAGPPGNAANAATIAVWSAVAVTLYTCDAVTYAVPRYVYVSVKAPAVIGALA